jgi:NADH-quinone oxidoreductase subunit F
MSAILRDLPGIDEYVSSGGYGGLKKALSLSPNELIAEIKKANLKGRGGAGFPTAMKWSFAAKAEGSPKYIVCNADEGEPGTFKDKPIMEKNPHMLIEGMTIAAYAVNASQGYIYLRGEYPQALLILETAISEARKNGFLGNDVLGSGLSFDLHLHKGAGAYICGEETALLDSLEGKRGIPRVKPPFPVISGYMGKPTVVNNVETFACVTMIMEIGAAGFLSIGPKDSPGPKLFSVSGKVERPGVYEAPMGITLRDLIYGHCGGMLGGKSFKGVIPGGVSTPIVDEEGLDCPLDFISMHDCGTMLGSGAVIVFDEDDCMVRASARTAAFFEHESCGKCTPCREGTGWLRAILYRIEGGQGNERDLNLIEEVSDNIEGKCFCALGDGAAMAARQFLLKYRDEFEAHVRDSRCPFEAQ